MGHNQDNYVVRSHWFVYEHLCLVSVIVLGHVNKYDESAHAHGHCFLLIYQIRCLVSQDEKYRM